MDKKKAHPRSSGGPLAAAVAVALTACISLAFLTYLVLPSGSPASTAPYGISSDVSAARRRQQQLSASAGQVALYPDTTAAGAAVWALSDAANVPLDGSTSILAHDFETKEPLPAVRGLPSTLAFTVAAVARPQHIASGERCLASHGGPEGRWTLSITTSGNLKLTVGGGGSGGDVAVPAAALLSVLPLGLEEWIHVAVGYDGEIGAAAFYFNGVLVPHTAPLDAAAAGTATALPLHEQPLLIGACATDSNPSELFTGSIGGLQIFDGLLSTQEALALWGAGAGADGTANAKHQLPPTDSKLVFAISAVPEIASILQIQQIALSGASMAAAAAAAAAGGASSDPSSPDLASIEGAARSALFQKHMSGFVTCAALSPAPHAFSNVGKPASGALTVTAWLRLASLPQYKEACILSHGSWERGWKLSILPYMNLQFSARTASGEILDFFSAPVTASLRWQHLAVTYSEEDATVAFYADGFPLDLQSVPRVSPGKAHGIIAEPAPLTVGRCSPNDSNDEELHAQLSDVMIWDGVLDFQAIRGTAHGAAVSGASGGGPPRRALPADHALLFSLPATGCVGRPIRLPSLPPSMAPPAPRRATAAHRNALRRALLQTAVVMSAEDDVATALRVLESVDHQASALLAGGTFGTIKTIVLAPEAAAANISESLESRYERLEVVITPRDGRSMVHGAAVALRGLQRAEEASGASSSSPGPRTRWVLMLTDGLKPLEHWLHHLMEEVVAASSKGRGAAPTQAIKSLTLTSGGVVKSLGIKHYLTVVSDGAVVPAPYFAHRGYKPAYVAKRDAAALSSEAEASTCESLLISVNALTTGARQIPADLGHLYECAALTAPVAAAGGLHMALSSWVLELQAAVDAARWSAVSDSMLRRHEMRSASALAYASLRGDAAMARINAALEIPLRVKWAFACGGSWAWEAASLVESLERRIALRIQMQRPFAYCGGHNVLGNAPLSFAERIERMVELPSLELEPVRGGRGGGGGPNSTPQKWRYKTPFPVDGTEFLQDDVVIYHRDWFTHSNFFNPAIDRPRFAIGRFMNEVTGVHSRVAQLCNELDEVWVPSAHHIDIYAAAGVERHRLAVVPESIDTDVFDPEAVDPLMLAGRKRYVFLANHKFEERKNWRNLIWAYCSAFSASDDVSLVIHTNLRGKFDAESMQTIIDTISAYIDAYVIADGSTRHTDASTVPHWMLTAKPLSTDGMISLYKAADAYVLPTHGEGWGLPYMEAMAMALPVISTGWSGVTEFMNPSNALLVRVQGFEESDPYDDWIRNFHWATPDAGHLAELMAWCFYNPQKAKELGRRARNDIVTKFSNQAVGEVIMARLRDIKKRLDGEGEAAAEKKVPLGAAYQWTMPADVKLCAHAPRAVDGVSQSGAGGFSSGFGGGNGVDLPRGMLVGGDGAAWNASTGAGAVGAGASTSSAGAGAGDGASTAAAASTPTAAKNKKTHADTGSSKFVVSAQPAQKPKKRAAGKGNAGSAGRGLLQARHAPRCPPGPARLAFLTPFPPRHDGLAAHAASLRNATLSACPDLTIDIFAIVLDFHSSYSEPYDRTIVRRLVFRESWEDYAAAAALANNEYDGVILNFKLGALGGSAGTMALCFARALTVPLVTVFHSGTHANMDEPLQFTAQMLLAESDAAAVASRRGRLGLDIAAGFTPSLFSALRPERVAVVPTGAPTFPEPTSAGKSWAKESLGMAGKRVLVTAGVSGPDKGAAHVLHGIDKLSSSLRQNLVYVIAGRRGDCGAACVEHYDTLSATVSDLNLTAHVVLMPEALSDQGWEDLWTAADVAPQIYPEDLNPHPATFATALAAGAVPVATPFAAARAAGAEAGVVLVWERDPLHVAAALEEVLAMDESALLEAQRAGWKAARGAAWAEVGRIFAGEVITPVLGKPHAAAAAKSKPAVPPKGKGAAAVAGVGAEAAG